MNFLKNLLGLKDYTKKAIELEYLSKDVLDTTKFKDQLLNLSDKEFVEFVLRFGCFEPSELLQSLTLEVLEQYKKESFSDEDARLKLVGYIKKSKLEVS